MQFSTSDRGYSAFGHDASSAERTFLAAYLGLAAIRGAFGADDVPLTVSLQEQKCEIVHTISNFAQHGSAQPDITEHGSTEGARQKRKPEAMEDEGHELNDFAEETMVLLSASKRRLPDRPENVTIEEWIRQQLFGKLRKWHRGDENLIGKTYMHSPSSFKVIQIGTVDVSDPYSLGEALFDEHQRKATDRFRHIFETRAL